MFAIMFPLSDSNLKYTLQYSFGFVIIPIFMKTIILTKITAAIKSNIFSALKRNS